MWYFWIKFWSMMYILYIYWCERKKTENFPWITPVIMLGGQETKYKPNICNRIYIYDFSCHTFSHWVADFSLINAVNKIYLIQINNCRICIWIIPLCVSIVYCLFFVSCQLFQNCGNKYQEVVVRARYDSFPGLDRYLLM